MADDNIYLRDYKHASLIFRSNNYQNAPKLKFLFHTFFDINPEAFQGFNRRGVGPIDAASNFGVLVKEVKLPIYTVETSTMNQYNRKRIVQTRLRYDPIDITFHDDNGDQINQLWEAYYTYYYYDALNPNVQFGGSRGSQGSGPNNYNQRNIYNESITNDSNWGFNGDSTTGSQVKVPFFKNITVFGFNQKNFTAYTLVNPIITNFTHDTYNYSEGGGTMQNRMTIAYETALYNYGALDGENPSEIVARFAEEGSYDRELSPIAEAGSNSLNLGNGGLVGSAGGSLQGNRRPPPNDPFGRNLSLTGTGTGPSVNFGANASNNSEKFPDLTVNSGRELNSMLRELPDPNLRNVPFVSPIPGATPSLLGVAGAPPIGTDIDPSTLRLGTFGLGDDFDQPIITDEPVTGFQYTGQDLTTGPRLPGDPATGIG